MVINKQGMYDGEVLGITLGVAEIKKLGLMNDQDKSYQVEMLRAVHFYSSYGYKLELKYSPAMECHMGRIYVKLWLGLGQENGLISTGRVTWCIICS